MSDCLVQLSAHSKSLTTISPQLVQLCRVEGTTLCGFDGEDEEAGSRRPAKVLDPQLPTKEEMEEHCLTHLPFRNWCQHCVRGAGRTADHRAHLRDDGLHELGTEGSSKETVLVVRERPHRMTMSAIVPMKGASLEWTVRRTLAFIKEIGLEGSPIVLKSDQEPAIVSLVGEIARRRGANIFPEHSPVSSGQSNGYIERAVQSVSNQVRVMLDVLESRVGQSCKSGGTATLTWLVEYASVLWNRYVVRADG